MGESATRYYYTAHDTSMYCYSDHDPLIIGLSLHSDVRDSCIEYMANFLYSLDDFIPISLQGDSIWHWHDNYLSAYIGGHHAGMEEDYLVSPYYDLTSMDSAKIYFNHAIGYGDVSQWENHCKLLISSDFYGADIRCRRKKKKK